MAVAMIVAVMVDREHEGQSVSDLCRARNLRRWWPGPSLVALEERPSNGSTTFNRVVSYRRCENDE